MTMPNILRNETKEDVPFVDLFSPPIPGEGGKRTTLENENQVVNDTPITPIKKETPVDYGVKVIGSQRPENQATKGAQTNDDLTDSGGTVLNDEDIINRLSGDGSDGEATISSNTTLAADKQYSKLTIDAGVTLTTAGYVIRVQGELIVNGTIDYSGNDGVAGTSGNSGGGAGGAALAGNTIDGGEDGKSGGGGGQAGSSGGTVGTNGDSVSPSVGGSGNSGGASGSGTFAAIAGGSGGTATSENMEFLLDSTPSALTAGSEDVLVTQFQGATSGAALSEPAGSGSGGGGSCTNSGDNEGGAGGGSGSTGGNLEIIANKITINSGGVISANGGDGGNGGAASGSNDGEGGGGGGGGTGGNVSLGYKTFVNNGTISVSSGTGGSGGAGNGAGGAGVSGGSSADGKVYRLKMS